MVGDSLNVGMEPYLEEELPGWRIETDDEVGRGSDDGIAALAGIGSELGPVVVVSLGTNDPQEDPDAFRADVREASLARRRPDGAWSGQPSGATEPTPPSTRCSPTRRARTARCGSSNGTRWSRSTRSGSIGDGVHGSPEGYAARAEATARVARDCLPAAAG